jgi:hypothetical protein
MRAFVIAIVVCGACNREASLCHERMKSAQAVVAEVDGKSVASVASSLAAVEAAYAACHGDGLSTERAQLLAAKNELSAQRDLLAERSRRQVERPPSQAELAELARAGDPSCPKGQAYRPRGSKQEIRCSGPQLVQMGAEALKSYFGGRRYRVTEVESPPRLRAEFGAESYVFEFERLDAPAPSCVTAQAPAGMSWQEVTSRLTGVAPGLLVLGRAVKVADRALPLRVEQPSDQPTIRLGSCG